MASRIDPKVHPVDIDKLHPTQMTVGFREVDRKRAEWREHMKHDGPDYLGQHMIPVVIGPKEKPYVVDHHHLVRALQKEGVDNILVNICADLSNLEGEEFWSVMDHNSWCHPFDENGRRHPVADIPKSIDDMVDDVYRSLAGQLRRIGGFAKSHELYSEFLWADFLRRRIPLKSVEDDFQAALSTANGLARQSLASHLPGWCGPAD